MTRYFCHEHPNEVQSAFLRPCSASASLLGAPPSRSRGRPSPVARPNDSAALAGPARVAVTTPRNSVVYADPIPP
jgi:hypothetical protein